MKVINAPEEMKIRAKNILHLEEAAKGVIRGLMMEIVKNHGEVVKLWNDVQREAEQQGLKIGENEIMRFDYVSDEFLIVPITKT